MFRPKGLHQSQISNNTFCLPVEFTDSPRSVTSFIGEMAEFRCSGVGSQLFWFVDGMNVSNMTTGELNQYGFSYSDPGNCPHCCGKAISTTLRITANCFNNKTRVQCLVYGNEYPHYGVYSDYAVLSVHGEQQKKEITCYSYIP